MGKSKRTKKLKGGSLTLYTVEKKDGKIVREPVEHKAYKVVGDELLAERLDPECWAKALAAGVKSRDEALSIYAKLRAEEVADKVSIKECKAKALEERRLVAGAPEPMVEGGVGWKRGYSLVWDFLFWQILLSVSGVGLFLALLAVGPDLNWWPGLMPAVILSAALQFSPIIFYGLGKLLIGRVSYTQALGFTAVCIIAMGSYMGVRTMMGKRAPSWLVAAIEQSVPKASVDAKTLDVEEF